MLDSTFSRQKSLPQMPVPNLKNTCDKLIEWAEPLLTAQELINTKQVIEQFLMTGGEGEKLQNDLIKLNNQDIHSNWAGPAWQNIYLECRQPLAINSNVFYYLKNKLDQKTKSQSHIATALIVSIYNFIALVDKQQLTVDMQKQKPLCMNQYKNIFSAIRVAQLGTDQFKVSESRKHIVVMHNMHIYKLTIIDCEGEIRAASDIEFDLMCILSPSEQGQNVGLLTTMPRDVWAKKRADLLQISSNNETAITYIEESTFVLCLDQN
ncbi:MAG: choline/carnitine O-acyltransferase, partial [Psychromonas sp.]